jgi:mRNA-degrading endonuclease YafQ of YafQ-DinJ toxin-antitoxin module
MRTLIWGNTFVRALKRTVRRHPTLRQEIADTLQLLQENPFAPQLATHKLRGKLTGSWACSVGYDLRIVFDFVKSANQPEDDILLLEIGTQPLATPAVQNVPRARAHGESRLPTVGANPDETHSPSVDGSPDDADAWTDTAPSHSRAYPPARVRPLLLPRSTATTSPPPPPTTTTRHAPDHSSACDATATLRVWSP